MGGVVSAPFHAITRTVKSIVNQPLKGIAQASTLAIKAPADAIGSLAPKTAGIPIIGSVTQGASSVSGALDRVTAGSLPTGEQARGIAAGGATVGGALIGGAPGVIIGDRLGAAALSGGGNFSDFLAPLSQDLLGVDVSSFFSSPKTPTQYAQDVASGGVDLALPAQYEPGRGNILFPLFLAGTAALAFWYLGKR